MHKNPCGERQMISFEQDKNSGKGNAWLLACIAFLLIVIAGIVWLVVHFKNTSAANSAYDELATNTVVAEQSADPDATSGDEVSDEQPVEESSGGLSPEGLAQAGGEEDESEEVADARNTEAADEAPDKGIDWDKLHETNADIYAWIYVPGTSVDYPVLQHPTDNEFYLMHNLDKSYGYPGVIYTEDYNSKDFTDPNTVLYGHNMDNTTMFSTLHKFSDPKMFETPHYIYIYTEDGRTLVYEIFAAYEYPSIHLLINFDVKNEYIYEQYLRNIGNMDLTSTGVANIRHDITPTINDRIITLSTCTTDHDANERFLVVGVLLNP
jgi:sortase B